MGIFVSCQANKISKQQLQLLQQEHLPYITIEAEDICDKKTGKLVAEDLRIINQGAPLYDIDIVAFPFLRIFVFGNGHDAYLSEPLHGLVLTPLYTHKQEGEIARIVSADRKESKMFEFEKAFDDFLMKKHGEKFSSISVQKIICISYKDKQSNVHKEFYSSDKISRILHKEKLSNKEGIRYFEKFGATNNEDYLHVEDITPEKVYQKLLFHNTDGSI
jgi:ribosomal protein L20A (L18A)